VGGAKDELHKSGARNGRRESSFEGDLNTGETVWGGAGLRKETGHRGEVDRARLAVHRVLLRLETVGSQGKQKKIVQTNIQETKNKEYLWLCKPRTEIAYERADETARRTL